MSGSSAQTALQILFSLILTVELILGVCVLADLQKRKIIHRALKVLFYGCIFVAWITSITFVVGFFLPPHVRDAQRYKLICIVWALSLLNFVLFYLTLVWRIYHTFSGTAYSPSKWWTLKCCIVTFLLLTLPIPRLQLNLRFDDYEQMRLWKYYTVSIVLLSTWTMTYLIASGLAVYVFYAKLMHVVKVQRASTGSSENIAKKEAPLSHRQQKFIGLASYVHTASDCIYFVIFRTNLIGSNCGLIGILS